MHNQAENERTSKGMDMGYTLKKKNVLADMESWTRQS